jgi:curved DNA-binding protein CbpA
MSRRVFPHGRGAVPDEVIRAAYRALANKYHPDRNGGDPNAELRLKRLNAAFQVLGDPAKRKQYDELTQSPQGSDDGPPEPTKEPPRWKVPEERASREPPHEPARVSSDDKPRSILRTILRVGGRHLVRDRP